MNIESETKFVPQWLQARQQNDSKSNGSTLGGDRFFLGGGISGNRENNFRTGSNGGRSGNIIKFQLAEHRYGREEMLALFDPTGNAPDDLKDQSIYIAEPLTPVSLMPMTEDEQVLFLQNVNSFNTYKPYVRGGSVRVGLRGEYADRGRGRGRGRDEDGRVRPREPWDDRPSRGHDYLGQGYDDSLYKPDFYSSASQSSFNRSNSNDSWRLRSQNQDYESNDYTRRDKWGPKNWRDPRGEGRLQEEPTFFRGSREQRPVDLKRSKSLYEEDNPAQKGVPEWSTTDDEDLSTEGSFDSSGAYLTSKNRGERPENTSLMWSKVESESSDSKSSPSNTTKLKEEEDNTKYSTASAAIKEDESINPQLDLSIGRLESCGPLVANLVTSTPNRVPVSSGSTLTISQQNEVVEAGNINSESLNIPLNNMKLDDTDNAIKDDRINLLKIVDSVVEPAAQSMVEPPLQTFKMFQPSPATNQQPLTYVRNNWYYKDPQGNVQGPFKDVDMAEWCFQGYFDTSLLLRPGEEGEFVTLGAFMSKVGGSLPFGPLQPPGNAGLQRHLPNVQAVPSNQSTLAQPSHSALSSLRHPVSTLHQEVLHPPLFYPQRPQQPPHHHQPHQPQPSHEPIIRFLPPSSVVPNTTGGLFANSSIQLPSLNGNISNTNAWSHTGVLQDKSMPEMTFAKGMSQNPNSIWNSNLNTSSNTLNMSGNSSYMDTSGLINDRAQQSFVGRDIGLGSGFRPLAQPQPTPDYMQRTAQLEWEQIEAEKKKLAEEKEQRMQESKMFEEMKRLGEVKMQQDKFEQLKMQRDTQRLEAELLKEKSRNQELMSKAKKQEEIEDQNDFLQQDNFKTQEEGKRQKESKRRKEAKRQEELKCQEELRRQEVAKKQELQRKLEEERKVEEQKRKQEEEEEYFRSLKEDEEAKRRDMEEDNGNQWKVQTKQSSKGAWSSNLLPTASKTEVPKLTEIQSIEQAKLMQQRQHHLTEQRLLAEQQKQQIMVAKSTGNIWKAPVAKNMAPKSLLDIQMEQASQPQEICVKAEMQVQVKVNDLPFGSSWIGTKDVTTQLGEVSKEPSWENSAPDTVAKKSQKPPAVLDNTQFPALTPAKSSAPGKKASANVKAAIKIGKEEAAVQKAFETARVKDELTEWCETALAGLKTDVDIPTLVDLLKEIDSPCEVMEYIHSYLGDSKQVREFAKLFIDRRSSFSLVKSKNKSWEINQWNVVGKQQSASSAGKPLEAKAIDKSNKKGKKKMQKVDANFLLGFTVHADPGRTNVGEIDTIPSATYRK